MVCAWWSGWVGGAVVGVSVGILERDGLGLAHEEVDGEAVAGVWGAFEEVVGDSDGEGCLLAFEEEGEVGVAVAVDVDGCGGADGAGGAAHEWEFGGSAGLAVGGRRWGDVLGVLSGSIHAWRGGRGLEGGCAGAYSGLRTIGMGLGF